MHCTVLLALQCHISSWNLCYNAAPARAGGEGGRGIGWGIGYGDGEMRLAVMGIDLDYCVLAACTTDLMHGPTKSAMMVYADCITEGVGEGGGVESAMVGIDNHPHVLYIV